MPYASDSETLHSWWTSINHMHMRSLCGHISESELVITGCWCGHDLTWIGLRILIRWTVMDLEGMLCLQIGRQSFSCGHVDLASEKNTGPEDVMVFSEALLSSISDHLTISVLLVMASHSSSVRTPMVQLQSPLAERASSGWSSLRHKPLSLQVLLSIAFPLQTVDGEFPMNHGESAFHHLSPYRQDFCLGHVPPVASLPSIQIPHVLSKRLSKVAHCGWKATSRFSIFHSKTFQNRRSM